MSAYCNLFPQRLVAQRIRHCTSKQSRNQWKQEKSVQFKKDNNILREREEEKGKRELLVWKFAKVLKKADGNTCPTEFLANFHANSSIQFPILKLPLSSFFFF
jgi:hypothetical protein